MPGEDKHALRARMDRLKKLAADPAKPQAALDAMHTTPDLSTDEAFFAAPSTDKRKLALGRGNMKHGLTGSHTYRQWHYIKRQCLKQGVRGFSPPRTLDPSWVGPSMLNGQRISGFQRFLIDMGKVPSELHTLHLLIDCHHYERATTFWRKRDDLGSAAGRTDAELWSDADKLKFTMRRVCAPLTPREEEAYASTEQGSEEAMPAARAYDQTAASSLGLGVPKFKEEDTLPDDVPVLSVAEAAAMGLFKPLTKAEVKALETAAAKCKTTAQRRDESFDEIVSPIPDEDFNDDA